MNKLTRSIMLAAALLAGGSAVAQQRVPDQSDQYGGYAPNSQEGARAFWENQSRGGE